MCYNDCEFFKFNPLEGDGRCTLFKKSICPSEKIFFYCIECDEEYELSVDTTICPICGCDELIEA